MRGGLAPHTLPSLRRFGMFPRHNLKSCRLYRPNRPIMTSFTNSRSLAALKASQNNAEIRLMRANSGKIFFACGEVIGYATEAALTEAPEDLQCVHITTDDGRSMEMICKRGGKEALRTL